MSLAPSFRVRYEAKGGLYEVCLPAGMGDPMSLLPIDVRVVHAAGETWESWRLVATTRCQVRVTSVCATMPCELRHAEALFLNGYNSWTDSVERSPWAGMRGLHGVPRAVVGKWALDGSGDYRFTKEDARPGHQHGFGYGYTRNGGRVTLFGSLGEDTGFTTLREDAWHKMMEFQKEPPARLLEQGETLELFSLAVIRDELGQAFSTYMDLQGIARRPAERAVGFSSWYRHYGQIDATCLARDFAGFRAVLDGLDTQGCARVFQIDDGYAKVGNWLQPDGLRFPEGLAPLASSIRAAGYVPGLWMAPFVCERESDLFRSHPDWVMRDEAGEPIATGSHWSGGVALDTRNPDVRAYVASCLGTATREWGFSLLKLDFLYAACMVPHDGLNRGQLMADALDLLRASVPAGVAFDLCGVPLVSAFGRCEYCRVGCDVGLDWDDKPYMRMLHRERVSTKNSLANTLGRAHLNGRAFLNDPDVFFLRSDVRLTPSQREDLLAADVACGGVLFTSDDMGEWGQDQLLRYRSAVRAFCSRKD